MENGRKIEAGAPPNPDVPSRPRCHPRRGPRRSFNFGDATVVYTDPQMPFTMDGSFATLNNGNGTTTFFETSGNSFYRYTGTAAYPSRRNSPTSPGT